MSELTRREAGRLLLGGSLGMGVASLEAQTIRPRLASGLGKADEAFLDDLERRGCLFFLEQAKANNGQVLDRAKAVNPDGALDPRRVASIAATGFGLAALTIADHRGFADSDAIRGQVLRTLRYYLNELPHQHGFFYHFCDSQTGQPLLWSEVSSIDTCLLLCGVLTARAHFADDTEIVRLATALYERVEWPWMLNGGELFSMGWKPKGGFLTVTWNHYCEMMMLPLLAMGSPTHPVGAAAWDAWRRPKMTYAGLTYIGEGDPLFVHQYSHAYFDFRRRRDRYANYFQNSVTATRAHRSFCLSLGKPYSADYWGISASDTAIGYQAWGGPPRIGYLDGSVVPCAVAGSLPFLPAECLRVLEALQRNYGERGWGRYGFVDAMHPEADWYNADVLGIDLGISVLMAENLRSGFIWKTFAKNPEINFAMEKAGFTIL